MKLTHQPHKHDDFDDLVSVMQQNVNLMTTPIFTIDDTSELANIWLENLPVSERQHHNCNCCKRFLETYGGIYTIDSDDVHRSLWAVVAPKKYKTAVAVLEAYVLTHARRTDKLAVTSYKRPERGRAVRFSTIAGKSFIGSGETGEFTHFEFLISTQDEKKAIHYVDAQERISNAAQRFRIHIQSLEAAVLKLADKRVTPMFQFVQKWFGLNGPERRNFIASSHDGQTHWSSSTLGSMVDLLEAGKSVDEVVALTKKKLDPLAYQRPQVVSAGQIDAAEKAFAEGGWAPSLERRNLLSYEVPSSAVIWRAKAPFKEQGHLLFDKVRQSITVTRPATQTQMSWALFCKSVLPQAKAIKVQTASARPATLTTAKNPKSKPILRHDSLTQRNPVAWWVPVSQRAHMPEWSDVVQVLRNVPDWYSGNTGDTVLLQLAQYSEQGSFYSGLFPELLTHEVRPYRAVIERHNMMNMGSEDNSQGVSCIQISGRHSYTLRVETVTGANMEVIIDRFE